MKKMKSAFAFAVLLAAGCASAPLDDHKALVGDPCAAVADCASGLVCFQGQCQTSCAPRDPCASGYSWNSVECKCTVPSGAEGDRCGGNISPSPPACQSGLVCLNRGGGPAGDVGGVCSKPCTGNGDCQCPATCDTQNGLCVGGDVACPQGQTYDQTQCACVPITCQPNGGTCAANADCCSGNCITRVSPGYCCEAGGCP